MTKLLRSALALTLATSFSFSGYADQAMDANDNTKVVVDYDQRPDGFELHISNAVNPVIRMSTDTMDGQVQVTAEVVKFNNVEYIIFAAKTGETEVNAETEAGAIRRVTLRFGETWIIRKSDGLAMRWLSEPVLHPNVNVNPTTGVLYADSRLRKIDLVKFDLEARFPTAQTQRDLDLEFARAHYDIISDDIVNDETIGAPAADLLEAASENFVAADIGSVVFLGDAGVGKTYARKTIMKAIKAGQTALPRTWKMIELDPSRLNSGASLVGQLEKRLEKLRYEAESGPTIVSVEEMHLLRGLGAHSASTTDAMSLLKSDMTNGKIRLFGDSTTDEFNAAFAGDRAIMRRIGQVVIPEIREAGILRQAMSGWLSSRNYAVPSDEVLDYVVKLSDRFNAMGAQPSKAIELLRRVYARQTVRGQAATAATLEDVNAAAFRHYNLNPRWFEDAYVQEQMTALQTRLNQRFVGLENLTEQITELTRTSFGPYREAGKPSVRVGMFGGPGTGKTEFGRTYAQALGLPFYRIDMAQYGPNGRGPDELQAEIARQLRLNAMTVFVVDEIEKAALPNQNALLAIFDQGEFTTQENLNSSQGRDAPRSSVRVSAREARFFVTGNAAAAFMSLGASVQRTIGFDVRTPEMRARDAQPAANRSERDVRAAVVNDGVSEPLIDRQQLVHGMEGHWSKEYFTRIVQNHLDRLIAEVQTASGIQLSISDREDYVNRLVDIAYFEGVTGRDAERIMLQVRRHLTAAIPGSPRGEVRVALAAQVRPANAQCAGNFKN